MKLTIETFVTFIIAILICVICSQFISMQVQTTSARQYHSSVIDKIENSDFNPTVINECIEHGEKYGYKISITDKTIDDASPCKMITLEYTANVPFLGIKENGKYTGYAR